MNTPGNFLTRYIGGKVNHAVENRIADYINTYARAEDGKIDDRLAFHIRREIGRRASMSMWMDLYEPAIWAAESGVLGIGAGLAGKYILDRKKPGNTFSTAALTGLMVTSALATAVQLIRLPTRYMAGLRGGLDTAFVMHDLEKTHGGPVILPLSDMHANGNPKGEWEQRIHDRKDAAATAR